MNLYLVLTLVVVSVFLGAALGLSLFARAINLGIKTGYLDVFIKGVRIDRWRMWS